MLCLNIWHLFPSVCKRSRFNIDCPVSQDVGIFVPKGRTNLFEIANRPHFFWQSRMYFSNRKGSNIGQRWWSVKLAFDQVTCTFSKVNFNRIMNPDRCTRGPISRCSSFFFYKVQAHIDTLWFDDFSSILFDTMSWTFNVIMIVLMPLTTYIIK